MLNTIAEVPVVVGEDVLLPKQWAMGEKKAALWAYLQRERVNPQEMLLTAEHVHQIAHQIECAPTYIHQLLKRFATDGWIRRKSERGKGTMVTFLQHKQKDVAKGGRPKKSASKDGFSRDTTFAQAISKIESEIAGLEKQLLDKRAFLAQLMSL